MYSPTFRFLYSIIAVLTWAIGVGVFFTASQAAAIDCDNMYGVFKATGGTCASYNIETPPTPPPAANTANQDLYYRWVPLCVDGSGDHDWSHNMGGTAPTCSATDYIRSIDGTRPMYYVDRARLFDGSSDTSSDNWVFWFQGGGSCVEKSISGVPRSAGENCYTQYLNRTERDEMGTQKNKASVSGGGILNPGRAENVFKTYNRVQIKKSSYDRFTGMASMSGAYNDTGDTFNLYWHGRRMIEAVINDLADITSFHDENGCNALPPLSNASRVILAGHSGGAGGLIMNGDWMAEQINVLSPTAKVRLVFDARWKPGLENEAGFDRNLSVANDDANGDGVLDAYDHIAPRPNPNNRGQLPRTDSLNNPYTYSRWRFINGGDKQVEQDQLAVPLDASCEAVHHDGAANCRDERHVLLNHIATPFFVREALRDSNHAKHSTDHADDLDFRFTKTEQKERVVYQLNRFVASYRTQSTLAQTSTPAPSWPFGIFATDSTVHAGIANNEQFFGIIGKGIRLCKMGVGNSRGDEISYHDALRDWVTHDREIIAIQHPTSVAGEYCDASDASCDCH